MALAQDILDDGGYRSRKYVALYVYWFLCTVGYGVTYWKTDMPFLTYWTALSTGLATYYGVNYGHSYLAKKAADGSTVEEKAEDAVKVPDAKA